MIKIQPKNSWFTVTAKLLSVKKGADSFDFLIESFFADIKASVKSLVISS